MYLFRLVDVNRDVHVVTASDMRAALTVYFMRHAAEIVKAKRVSEAR